MSTQSLAYWNGSEAGDRALVGFGQRPWWYDASLQGSESNLYDQAIPVGDVVRRLFSWQPVELPVYVAVPAGVEDMTALDGSGQMIKLVVQPDRKAIAAGDTLEVLGMFKDGYRAHSYATWLLGNVSNLVGGNVGIGSAGFPVRTRAQAWVQVRTPDEIQTPEGVTFLPHLLAYTSLDGTLATTYKMCSTVVVCDNTFAAARGQGRDRTTRIKHTRNSNLRITDAQQALGLISEAAESFAETVRDLCAWDVTDLMFDRLLDKMIEPGVTQRSQTMAASKRAQIVSLYRHDNRAATWAGTAFGALQAFDTYERHYATVRGASRPERQISGVIDGTYDALDDQVLKVLATV